MGMLPACICDVPIDIDLEHCEKVVLSVANKVLEISVQSIALGSA